MSKPPKIVIPGLNRGAGIPPGTIVGRLRGAGNGPAQLLGQLGLRAAGIATTVVTNQIMAVCDSVVLSTALAADTPLSTSISAISSSLSGAISQIGSLSTAVSSVDLGQSTSLSQINSSLSGAISSTSSLSTAVSTVVSGSISTVTSQVVSLSTGVSTSLSSDLSKITSLSTAVSTVDASQSTSLSQISSSLSGAISSTSSLSAAVSTVDANQSSSLSTIVSSYVTNIVAGTNISISPAGGTGAVTVNATGGGGGGGTVTHTAGALTAGQLIVGNGGADIEVGDLSGDVTTSGSGVTTIKSNVALAGSPTTTTQAAGDSSTKIATDAFVTTAVNNAIAGVNPAVAVAAATVAAADTSSYVYNNGVSGVGATLTGPTANVAVTIDGFTFTALGQRLLVKNDTQAPSGAFNGVYYVTTLQAPLVKPVLTRALDYDQSSDINNTGAIPVVNGTVNASTSWLLTSSVTTVGTDPLTYTQFSLSPSTIVTSAAALTNHGVVLGKGTQVVGATAAGTLGTVLTGNGAADPTFQLPYGLPTAAPVMRGTTAHTTTGASQAMALPAGTVAGDLAVLAVFGGNGVSGITNITGWTSYLTGTGGHWNTQVYTKILTSGDITAASVTVSFSAFQEDLFLTTFAGAPTIYGAGALTDFSTGTELFARFFPLIAAGPWATNGLHLIYISGRINGTQACDQGSIIGSALTAANGSASLYSQTFGYAVPLANCDHSAAGADGIGNVMIGFVGP